MIIYKCTNKLNGKVYIGQTTKSLKDRKAEHFQESRSAKTYFHKALRRYGKEGFIWEIIDTSETVDELNEKEIFWIKKLKSTDSKFGYNLKEGGSQGGGWSKSLRLKHKEKGSYLKSKETKEKLSKSAKERIAQEGYVNPFKGKTHSKEVCLKMSEKRKGIPHTSVLSEEGRKNIIEYQKNKIVSIETRQKLREYFQKLPKETIQEIREGFSGKRGEKATLSRKYGVDIDVITRIVGKSYIHKKFRYE